jgi:hypothetical protein
MLLLSPLFLGQNGGLSLLELVLIGWTLSIEPGKGFGWNALERKRA